MMTKIKNLFIAGLLFCAPASDRYPQFWASRKKLQLFLVRVLQKLNIILTFVITKEVKPKLYEYDTNLCRN